MWHRILRQGVLALDVSIIQTFQKCIIATWIGSVILLLTVGYTLLHIFILGGIEWVVYTACFIAAWFGVVICQSCIAAHIFA